MQIFHQWHPVQDAGTYFSIAAIIDDGEGLRICLHEHGTGQRVTVVFKDHLAYQCRDESDLEGEAARSTGLGRGCFYRVKGSEFQTRFERDSVRCYDGIAHFAFVSDARCVDVLALGKPVVIRL